MTAPQYAVHCKTCSALPFEPCRTRKTGRVTDTHLARIDCQAGTCDCPRSTGPDSPLERS